MDSYGKGPLHFARGTCINGVTNDYVFVYALYKPIWRLHDRCKS